MRNYKALLIFIAALFFTTITLAGENTITGTRLTFDTEDIESELDAVWSPDKQYLAFTISTESMNSHRVIIVMQPSTGFADSIYEPQPTIVDSVKFYPSVFVSSFSADCSEIFFWENVIDIERGTVINITKTPGGYSASMSGGVPTLKAVNVNTKSVRTVLERVTSTSVKCSKDGKYLLFQVAADNEWDYPSSSLATLNFETGQTSLLLSSQEITSNKFCITPDSKYVMFVDMSDNILKKVPINGGVIDQVAELSPHSYHFSMSDDSKLLLYQTETTSIDTIKCVSPSGVVDSRKSTHRTINALNMDTGKYIDIFEGLSFDLFPLTIMPGSKIRFNNPEFSADGKHVICSLCFSTGTQIVDELFFLDIDVNEYLKTLGEVAVETETAPDAFAIKGNYPNPFNPSTTIEFTIPNESKIDLMIYNSLGQKIRTLVSDNLRPGAHSFVWDGKDDNGNAVSSGVYLSSLSMGGRNITKRMTLLK